MDRQEIKQLDQTQKIGFVLLTVFGVLVLVLGAYQFRTTIYGPTAIKPYQPDQELSAIEDIFDDEDARLQRIDTDQDGINDYEELNFYNTSPYIADTDSDGVDDFAEIEAGEDPLCPRGSSDCSVFDPSAVVVQNNTNVGSSPLLEGANDATDDLYGALGTTADTDVQVPSTNSFDDLPENSQQTVDAIAKDPEAIRDLLRQSGQLTEEQIAAFSDEQLLAAISEVLNQQ